MMTLTKAWMYHPKEWIVGALVGTLLMVGNVVLLEAQRGDSSFGLRARRGQQKGMLLGMNADVLNGKYVYSYLSSECNLEDELFCGPTSLADWYTNSKNCVYRPSLHDDVAHDDQRLEEYFNELHHHHLSKEEVTVRTTVMRVAIDAADANVRKLCGWTCGDVHEEIEYYHRLPSMDRQKVIKIAERVFGPGFVDYTAMAESTKECGSMPRNTLLSYLLKNSKSHYKPRAACLVKLVLEDGYGITEQCQESQQAVAEMPLPLEVWLGGIPIAGVCFFVSSILFLVTIFAAGNTRNHFRISESRKERAERRMRESLEDPLLRSSLEKELKNQFGEPQAECIVNKLQMIANQSPAEQADIAWKEEEGRRNALEQAIRLVWTVRKVMVYWFGCHFLFLTIDWYKADVLLNSMTVLSFTFVLSYEAHDHSSMAPLVEQVMKESK